MSDLQRKVLAPGLPPRPVRGGLAGSRGGPGGGPGGGRKPRDYTPVSWDRYFSETEDVRTAAGTFRVYRRGETGPVLLFLHGGGFSALSWALLSVEICELVECRCLAVDLRGHGDSHTNDDTDLSADTLASDVGVVVETLYGDAPPPVILIGHSMGGAIAVHVASQGLLPSLIGLAVIDVVEGTALDALHSMQSFLKGRPQKFPTLEKAIEWSVRANQIRNVESARVSMVGQLKKVDAAGPVTTPSEDVTSSRLLGDDVIMEEEDGANEESPTSSMAAPSQRPLSATSGYTWRIDLSQTDRYWEGWFSGLSQRFLGCNVPKMLLLAGIDRLDKDLTIGQMQGKFQMQVLPQCGHAVHEDVPDRVANVLATFMHRNRVATIKDSFTPTMPAC